MQTWREFQWRYCSFPLVREGVTKARVDEYWSQNGWLGSGLFEQRRQIKFPAISNCVGCFHKKPETLAAMAEVNPEKFAWFASQEEKGKGTWLDSRQTYASIAADRKDIAKEVLYEVQQGIPTCDSGGCSN